MARGKKALLIFADARALDLRRRRFSSQLGALFRSPSSAISLAPGIDRHLFTAANVPNRLAPVGSRASADSVTVHPQQGTTFAGKLEAAVEKIAALGYAEVVVIGADCPELGAADIATAFEQLDRHALVLGPDQRGGCYLIGLRLAERSRLHGVRWQQDTDCRQLAVRFGPARTFLLPCKLDLDTLADVRLLARCAGNGSALARALLRVLEMRSRASAAPVRFSAALHRLRARWQLPPPLAGMI